MPMYRFRFHDCGGAVKELGAGTQATDLAGARAIAVGQARTIMAREIQAGRLCLTCWIVISDERGNNVATLQFGDAIDLATGAACDHHDGRAHGAH